MDELDAVDRLAPDRLYLLFRLWQEPQPAQRSTAGNAGGNKAHQVTFIFGSFLAASLCEAPGINHQREYRAAYRAAALKLHRARRAEAEDRFHAFAGGEDIRRAEQLRALGRVRLGLARFEGAQQFPFAFR